MHKQKAGERWKQQSRLKEWWEDDEISLRPIHDEILNVDEDASEEDIEDLIKELSFTDLLFEESEYSDDDFYGDGDE